MREGVISGLKCTKRTGAPENSDRSQTRLFFLFGYFIQSILNKIEMPRTHLPNLTTSFIIIIIIIIVIMGTSAQVVYCLTRKWFLKRGPKVVLLFYIFVVIVVTARLH